MSTQGGNATHTHTHTPDRPAHPHASDIDGLEAAGGPARNSPGDEAELALATCDKKDFSFAGQQFLAKIVSYCDGDTVRVVFKFKGERVQYRARLKGYDSPEMKPLKSHPDRMAEKAAAVAARAALIDKTADGLVYIECGEFDKYGRLLVTMYSRASGENINEWMVANGHGTPYAGGRKPCD